MSIFVASGNAKRYSGPHCKSIPTEEEEEEEIYGA